MLSGKRKKTQGILKRSIKTKERLKNENICIDVIKVLPL